MTPPSVEQSRLFSPLAIRHHILRNRIVNAPHQTHMAQDGRVTPQQIAYYEARAAGGAAMIVAGSWAAWRRTWPSPLVNLAAHPTAGEGHVALADAVHSHGTLLVGQLHDSGRQGSSGWQRLPLLAPSAIADPVVREIPKTLEQDEIDDMVASHAASAAALCEAGWDGVEIFAAQGYALAQFISPQSNRRADQYGGELRSRLRIVVDILEAVRSAIGSAPLVGVRMNYSDLIAGGLQLDESREVARILEGTAAVDYLSVSAGSNEDYPSWIADMAHARRPFAEGAAAIRAEVSLPVLVTTRIKDRQDADHVLESGQADMVGMTRALIADPDLPRKLEAGQDDLVRPCIGCNQGCLGSLLAGGALRCTVNPRVGREGLLTIRTRQARRALVVGAGPAGLQAAVTLAERGHDVTVWERGKSAGGQLAWAGMVPTRAELTLIIDSLVALAAQLRVRLVFDKTATVEDLRAANADVIILATGSSADRSGYSSGLPWVRAIPGHDLKHVRSALETVQAGAVDARAAVVVDDDPHGQATSVAEFLGLHGVEVHLVTRSLHAGSWAGPANLHALSSRLGAAGVRVHAGMWVDRILEHAVELHGVFDGRTEKIEDVDLVVLATGNIAESALYDGLRRSGETRPVIRVGDCLAPRRLDHAIWDGFTVDIEEVPCGG